MNTSPSATASVLAVRPASAEHQTTFVAVMSPVPDGSMHQSLPGAVP